MTPTNSVELVGAWVAAANAQDGDRLLALSDSDIEVGGPRGAGRGHQLLRDWMDRAGLTLETLRAFARGRTVVLEQRGVWRDAASGEVTGERALASLFVTDEQRVARFARYDDLDAALAAAGLDRSDAVG